jgi:hypothetical protein
MSDDGRWVMGDGSWKIEVGRIENKHKFHRLAQIK